jgi:hypothetical protein
MTGTEYGAVIAALMTKLAGNQASNYGRGSEHHFGACAVCNIAVCLSHHRHTAAAYAGPCVTGAAKPF